MKDVVINIVGTVRSEGTPETIELTTVGRMTEKNGKWYIIYDEEPEQGMGKTRSMLKVEREGTVIIQRSGGHNSRLTVERGIRHMSHYSTGYGDLMIGVFGKEVRSSLSLGSGELYMKYTVDINAGFSSENEVCVKIKEAKNHVQNS
jgi:uncharacterized beta-barrel protein YwiB (DUF1934 family)